VLAVLLAVCPSDLWLWRVAFLARTVVGRPILTASWRAELTVVWRKKDRRQMTNNFRGATGRLPRR
jgi:hypothetical protein